MKKRQTVVAASVLFVCGLAAVLVSPGSGGENEITILKPAEESPALARPASPDAAVSAPTAKDAPVPGIVPIGSVVAWLKSCTNTPSLSAQWVECNGQPLVLPESPYHGMTIPNLNGAGNQEKRFLRGSVQSGATGGADTHNHGLTLIDRGAKKIVNIASKENAAHLPPYYEVTWIMRVL